MKKIILTIAYFGVAGVLLMTNSCQQEDVQPNDPCTGTTPTWNSNDSLTGGGNTGGGTGNPCDSLTGGGNTGGGATGGGTGNPNDTLTGGGNTGGGTTGGGTGNPNDSLPWNP